LHTFAAFAALAAFFFAAFAFFAAFVAAGAATTACLKSAPRRGTVRWWILTAASAGAVAAATGTACVEISI